MRKLIYIILLFAGLGFLIKDASAQRNYQETGQINGKDAAAYWFVCGPQSTSAVIPVPPAQCDYRSPDLATIYSACGNSTCSGGTTITQPLSVAAGVIGTWIVPSTAGTYRIAECSTAGAAATGSADQIDPTGCAVKYVDPSCPLKVTNVAGQDDCGSASGSLPSVPSTGFNRLASNAGASPAYVCDSGADTPTVQSAAVNMSGTASTSYATMSIAPYRVCASGLYTVSIAIRFCVPTGMTASTFTPTIYYYDAALASQSTLMGGIASASVAAGSCTTTYGSITLAAPASGTSFSTSGGFLVNGPALSTSILTGSASTVYFGSPHLLATTSGNQIQVYVATSTANSTPNTVQIIITGHS